MTRVQERQAQLADVRKLPITPKLSALLDAAAQASGVDAVVVFSGGQYPAGTGHPHIGSPRHDYGNAADVWLEKGGRKLSFENPGADRDTFAAFAKSCAAHGATGIGAAVDYMGPTNIHVGYGARAVWGTGGHSAGAPDWLVKAVETGWAGTP